MSFLARIKQKVSAISEPTIHNIRLPTDFTIYQWNLSKEIDCKKVLEDMIRYGNEYPFHGSLLCHLFDTVYSIAEILLIVNTFVRFGAVAAASPESSFSFPQGPDCML